MDAEAEGVKQEVVEMRLPEEQEALDHVWVHSAQFNDLAMPGGMKVLVRGEGVRMYDIRGREYIDAISGLFLVNVGHGRKEIARAIAEQAGTLAYVSATSYVALPTVKLATKLADLLPGELSRIFFVSGGSEATESAMKIAKQCQVLRGFPKRYKVIARRYSYHGATLGSMSATGIATALNHKYFAPMAPGFFFIPAPYCYRCDFRMAYPTCELRCAEAMEQTIEFEGPETVAAVIGEPISDSCGVVVPPPEYWPKVREICDRHGVLLILDEVINGFGRTGKMFASQHWGVAGDLMTMAKGLTSGYVPMGACAATPAVAQAFVGEPTLAVRHLLTFGGQAVAAAAALVNLEIIEREELVGNAARMGAYLMDGLKQLRKHPVVGDVRGLGLFAGVEVVRDRKTKAKFRPEDQLQKRLTDYMQQEGILIRAWDVIRVAPPLCVSRSEIDRIIEALDRSLAKLESDLGITA